MIDLARVLLDWHVLLIAGCLLVILPVIFFISSLDKTPVKIRRVAVKRARPAAAGNQADRPPRDENMDEVPANRDHRGRPK